MLPQHFALAALPRQYPGDDEQQIRQPVEIALHLRPHALLARQAHHLALAAAEKRESRNMEERKREEEKEDGGFWLKKKKT